LKALYSFWSKPLRENISRCKSERNFALMFIYSMLWASKWFEKVEMNTDNYGYNIFKHFESDRIKIKNTLNIFDHLDSYLFWAYPKIYSLTLQDEPFVHLDGDIFIFRRLPQELFSGDFAFQNLETTYYQRTYSDLVNHYDNFCPNKPIEWDNNLKSAVNCGIMYFKDPSLAKAFHDNCYKHFINLDDDFLFKLKNKLENIIKVTYITYPLLYEQYYLNCFINFYNNYNTNYLLSKEQIAREEKGELTIQGYVHLIEDKNNPRYIKNIQERFSIEFPIEYRKFLTLDLK
jgi:hypothetical protein